MSEVEQEQEQEVEVTDEVSSQDQIRNMMDKWAEGDVTGAQDEFNAIVGSKADALVQGRREEMANTVFNDNDPKPDERLVPEPAPENEPIPKEREEEPAEEEQEQEQEVNKGRKR